MSDDEHAVVICTPCAHGRVHIVGSVVARCADCTNEIWVSPSSLRVRHATLLCWFCAEVRIEADPDPKLAPLTREQREELRKWNRSFR